MANMINDATLTISWQAPDFIEYKKSNKWYIIISLIGLGLLVLFFFIKLYAAMAVVVAALIALFVNANLKPEIIKYTITDAGISFKNKEYSFGNLKSFFIDTQAGYPRLLLEQNGKFKAPLSIIIGKINPKIIQSFLLKKLPENSELAQSARTSIDDLIKF